jgi:hypothetical protein
MFFLILLIALMWFHAKTTATTPMAEMWFMLGIFAGLAYIAGFLDSRIYARLDKKNANLPPEADNLQK